MRQGVGHVPAGTGSVAHLDGEVSQASQRVSNNMTRTVTTTTATATQPPRPPPPPPPLYKPMRALFSPHFVHLQHPLPDYLSMTTTIILAFAMLHQQPVVPIATTHCTNSQPPPPRRHLRCSGTTRAPTPNSLTAHVCLQISSRHTTQ
jgi:hypothetical protein